MKKVLAILLLACVSYQLVAKMGIMVWYEVNKDYIAEELLENKDKPKLQCNGSGDLHKQISKVELKEVYLCQRQFEEFKK